MGVPAGLVPGRSVLKWPVPMWPEAEMIGERAEEGAALGK